MAEHLGKLADEGRRIAKLEKPASFGAYIQGDDKIPLHAWLAQVRNVIVRVFGETSQHYKQLEDLTTRPIEHSYEVFPLVGLLEGARADLEGGYLVGQKLLIAGEIFDSVLDQAEHLNQAGHKDPAAAMMRVVLEDSLRRLCSEEGLDATRKASGLNDELKRVGRYAQPQWRLVQAWLDIGNAAAHGKFGEYDQADVARSIRDVRRFVAAELRAR